MSRSAFKSILDELPDSHRAALTRVSIKTGQSVDDLLKEVVLTAARRLAGDVDPDPTADCDLRKKKVVRARDHRPIKEVA